MIRILEDTRQQASKHNSKHDYFRSVGVMWERVALRCGDYTLPANQHVCIDTKKDIQELIGDIQVKKAPKNEIARSIEDIFTANNITEISPDKIYHIITDDDDDRCVEDELTEYCFNNYISEDILKLFKDLYIKRHGFFHRGLKRAKNSDILLYVLVENKDGISSIKDLLSWVNPRLKIFVNTDIAIGRYKNGRVRYKKVQKSPYATKGEQLAKSLYTMEKKYGVKFLFCKPEESGKIILQLLGVKVGGADGE